MVKIENLQLLSNAYIHIVFSSFKKHGIWWERNGKNWWNGKFVYDTDFLYYIEYGEISLVLNGKEYTAHEGQMVYVPAGTTIERKILSHDSVRKYYTAFNLMFGESTLTNLFKVPHICDVKDKKTVEYLFETLCACHRDVCALNGIKARGILLQLIAHYLEESHAEHVLKGNKMEKSMRKVVQFINSNLNRQITVSELSSITGYSKDYFTRIFKQSFDCLPLEYVASAKMNYAKKRLRDTNAPITEIAEELGFCDSSHFSKFFRRHIGIPPNEYRKNVRFRI